MLLRWLKTVSSGFQYLDLPYVYRSQSQLKFSKLEGDSEPYVQSFVKLCQKLRLIMLI